MSISSDLIKKLKSLECPDSTFGGFNPPIILDKAFDSTIIDVEGKSYIDLCAGFGSTILGHNPDAIREVFSKYSNQNYAPLIQGMGDVYPTSGKIKFLDEISNMMPAHLNRGALSLTGSQSVEFAIRSAHLYNGKKKFIAFKGGYHGTELGVLSLTWSQKFSSKFTDLYPQDTTYFLPFNGTISEMKSSIKEQQIDRNEISAVIVEPIQGRNGIIIPDKDWLKSLADLTKELGALLIFDEVFTGFGRTGEITQSHLHHCDILCIGKALGGGIPLSGCFSSDEIMNSWPESSGEAIHTGTFFGHSLSCEIGLNVLEEFQNKELWKRSKTLGKKSLELLRENLKNPKIKEIRGIGLMLAIELQAGKGIEVMGKLRKLGVHALVSGAKGESISITPALNISEENLFFALDKIIYTINKLE